jgi:hypothetical protein
VCWSCSRGCIPGSDVASRSGAGACLSSLACPACSDFAHGCCIPSPFIAASFCGWHPVRVRRVVAFLQPLCPAELQAGVYATRTTRITWCCCIWACTGLHCLLGPCTRTAHLGPVRTLSEVMLLPCTPNMFHLVFHLPCTPNMFHLECYCTWHCTAIHAMCC